MTHVLPNPRRQRRGRGHGSRRRRNPWTRGQKIAAVVGVGAAVGAVLAIRRMMSGFTIGDFGTKKETINFNYVPHLDTWPHRDRYGSEHSFGLQLQEWGYDPGPINTNAEWTIIDAQPIAAVSDFQRDYNLVRQIDLPAPTPGPELVDDGLIGHNTANSFWQAEQWTISMNMTWPQLVDLARGELGVE